MSAIDARPKTMDFALRPLQEQDIPQSVEIERDAFPNHFPQTSFRRELKNRIASYLVAWRPEDVTQNGTEPLSVPDAAQVDGDRPLISRLLRNARSFWPRRHSAWAPGQPFVAGFLGLWYIADEAHVVSVGVREGLRGLGIGELLLIGAIEQAMSGRAKVVTLEARVSNYIARNLYLKYGFKERGIRKGYYTDNREDAVIMAADPINLPSYQERFRKLAQAHEQRWGYAERILF